MARRNTGADESSLASIKRYINFVVVKLDHVILDAPNPLINYLSAKGELSGFRLAYQIPRAARGNPQLDREVLANGDLWALGRTSCDQMQFKHKKVFPIELDSELIDKWEQSTLQIALSAVTATLKIPNDRKGNKHLARACVPLSDLLVPPYRISRDCNLVGNDFTGRISLSLELGSRNVRVAEILSELRKSQLDDTYIVNERQPARRTRSRSTSRCRSHEEENRRPLDQAIYIPKPLPRSRPSTARSVTDYTNHLNMREASPEPLRPSRQPEPIRGNALSDDDTVYAIPERPSSRRAGALQLELTLHSARDLPLVQDRNGRWVPPMTFIQVLGRDEQIMSTISRPDCNPVWNWTGKFVISSERGNVLVKVLHRLGDQICPLGVVTLGSPLFSFDDSEFEISLTSTNVSGAAATITMSLEVQPHVRVVSSSGLGRDIASRSSQSSDMRINPEPELPVDDLPAYVPYRRPRSVTPPRFMRAVSTEALRNKLKDDVDELLDVMNRLGR